MAALARISRKTLTSYALSPFRSNVQVRFIIHGIRSPPGSKHSRREPESKDKPVFDPKLLPVDTRGWIKSDDPSIQFDCVIDHDLRAEHRMEIPDSFINQNRMKNVSQVRLYGKAGNYFTCELKRDEKGFYVQGHPVLMFFNHLHLKAGCYMIFKLKRDDMYFRNGTHSLHVMKIRTPDPKPKRHGLSFLPSVSLEEDQDWKFPSELKPKNKSLQKGIRRTGLEFLPSFSQEDQGSGFPSESKPKNESPRKEKRRTGLDFSPSSSQEDQHSGFPSESKPGNESMREENRRTGLDFLASFSQVNQNSGYH